MGKVLLRGLLGVLLLNPLVPITRPAAETLITSDPVVHPSLLIPHPSLPLTDEPIVRGPAWLQDNLVYYHAFESPPSEPAINRAGLELVERGPVPALSSGLFGRALDLGERALTLRGDALSAHRPLTLSFWWALGRDLPLDGGFSLFQFTGRGIIAAFTRGKGEWCALQRPAGVLQVYYFPGIQNVNGIYDFDLASHLDLRAGIWHHTAAVLRRASTVQLYTDGRLVHEITISGREFAAADDLRILELGSGIWLDELAILNRAVDGEMIADYWRGMTQLRLYHQGAPDR